MDVKLIYSKAEFDSAVKFIARNNRSFIGATDIIQGRLHDALVRMAQDPQATTMSTMGFMLIVYREEEGIDSDECVARIDIFVDPALGLDHNAEDWVEEILT